jgi:hypothetical protein
LDGRQDFAYAFDKDEECNLKVVQARVVAIAKTLQQFHHRELTRSDNLPPTVSDPPGLYAYS